MRVYHSFQTIAVCLYFKIPNTLKVKNFVWCSFRSQEQKRQVPLNVIVSIMTTYPTKLYI